MQDMLPDYLPMRDVWKREYNLLRKINVERQQTRAVGPLGRQQNNRNIPTGWQRLLRAILVTILSTVFAFRAPKSLILGLLFLTTMSVGIVVIVSDIASVRV